MPYARARIDDLLPGTRGPSNLNIGISCGLWSYEGSSTAAKIFNFHVDKFSDPVKLQNLVTHCQDMIKSMKQMGIDLKDQNIAIIGYEVMFPKGFRYKVVDFSDIKNFEPIEYVAKNAKVIINTSSALREFFLQVREFASDKRGNAMIPVVVRLGIKENDRVWGGKLLRQFTKDWRSDLEKKWLAEEKRISLERQQFASEDEQRRIQERMKAITDAADRAMTRHAKDENMMDMDDKGTLERKSGNRIEDDDDFEIDIDIDLDLDC